MITPSPTTKLDPHLARGNCIDIVEATATKPGHVVFGVPNTNYELHLLPTEGVRPVGIDKRLIGTIKVQARRVDVVRTGGRFIEPVFGRPRRVQGSVVAVDAGQNTVTVNAGVPITLTLTDPRQQAAKFEVGQIVSCDVHDGATFTPKG